MRTTYFAVQSYIRGNRGGLAPGRAMECLSAAQAVRLAQSLSEADGAAVAFSRECDPEIGAYEDAVVLGLFGFEKMEEEIIALAS